MRPDPDGIAFSPLPLPVFVDRLYFSPMSMMLKV